MKPKILSLTLAALSLMVAPFAAGAEVSDADFSKAIEKYLSTDKGQEQVGKAIENYFKKRQADAQKQQQEQAAADLENQFKNPVKIEIGNSPVKGPADAKITVIEFSDLCPFCKRGKDTMDDLLKAHPGQIKLVFKNLPLPFHEQALPAAKAAWAAGKQGKFWEMHDALFANQAQLKPEFYLQQAQSLGLDMDKFKKDMESPEAIEQFKKEKAQADQNQISGTPGFFVNGVAVRGAYPLDHFKTIVDRWLKGAPKA